jgi:integrase/recombinase XerD
MRRPNANRDQAIILTLLDTGLRATELYSLTVEDLDLKTGKVNVRLDWLDLTRHFSLYSQ